MGDEVKIVNEHELERRRYIRVARQDPRWQEVVASFAISGIVPDEFDEELAGRYISGSITYKEALRLIRSRAGVDAVPEADQVSAIEAVKPTGL